MKRESFFEEKESLWAAAGFDQDRRRLLAQHLNNILDWNIPATPHKTFSARTTLCAITALVGAFIGITQYAPQTFTEAPRTDIPVLAQEHAHEYLQHNTLPPLTPLFQRYLALVPEVSERTQVPSFVLEGIIYGANGRDDMPYFESREMLNIIPAHVAITPSILMTDREQCLLATAASVKRAYTTTQDWREAVAQLYSTSQEIATAHDRAETFKNIHDTWEVFARTQQPLQYSPAWNVLEAQHFLNTYQHDCTEELLTKFYLDTRPAGTITEDAARDHVRNNRESIITELNKAITLQQLRLEQNQQLQDTSEYDRLLGNIDMRALTKTQAREFSYWPQHLPEKAKQAILMMDICEALKQ